MNNQKCYRVYANGQLMSTFTTLKDAEQSKRQLQWFDTHQTREPYLNDRMKKAVIEIREELINKD